MADQEARDELRRLLDAAVGRMLMEGLGWDQVVDEVRRRLAEEPEIPADLWGIPVGATMRTGSRMWRRLDNGPSGQVRGEVVEYARVDLSGADAERRMLDRGEWPPRLDDRAVGAPVTERLSCEQVHPQHDVHHPEGHTPAELEMVQRWLLQDDDPHAGPPQTLGQVRTAAEKLRRLPNHPDAPLIVHDGRSLAEQLMQQEQGSGPPWPARATVVEAAAPDAPGEPPVGSVVQDTRSRVCWRDEAGWHRSDGTEGGAERVLTWHDVVQAVGPDPQNPRQLKAMPGPPTITVQPPARAEVPMVTRPAGQLEMRVQHAVLGPDGEPMVGPNGQKLLKTETETVAISEVVPASEARP